MEKLERSKEQNKLLELADKLEHLQGEKNNGRGVSCVKILISCLREGDVRSAKAVCWNEADKIVNYPDISKVLQEELFAGDDEKDIPPHFRASMDKVYGELDK